MNDDLIRHLGQISLAKGGMKALRQHFSRQAISGAELDQQAHDSEIAGHSLLHSVAGTCRTLEMPYPAALEALSGTGSNYSGLFGNVPASGVIRFGRHEVVLGSSDAAPADIATRVTLCLSLLSSAKRLDGHTFHDAVQRCLSSLLLEHPVLLHPKILVPIYRTGSGLAFMSLAHAIASARDIGLPRLSHFDASERAGMASAFKAFSEHPCVAAGWGKSKAVKFDSASGILVQECRTHAEHALVPISPRLQFMASAMELQHQRDPLASELGLPLNPSTPEEISNVVQTVAMGLLAGSGAAVPATASDGLRFPQAIDREFLEQVRLRQASIDRTGVRSDFDQKLALGATARVFGGRFESISLEEMEHAARAIADAFVLAGVAVDGRRAALHLMSLTLGPDRPNGHLPRVEIPVAIGFLRLMDSLGAFGSMGDPASDAEASVHSWRQVIASVPAHEIPHRAAWLCALDVWWREKVLLRAVSSATDPTSQPAPAAAAAHPARSRHAL